YVWYGGPPLPAGTVLTAAQAGTRLYGVTGDHLGAALAPAGDLDGDGLPDLAVSAEQHGPDKAGAVFLVPGAALPGVATIASVTQHELQGAEAGDLAGTAIVGDIDFNGDLRPDLLVGA